MGTGESGVAFGGGCVTASSGPSARYQRRQVIGKQTAPGDRRDAVAVLEAAHLRAKIISGSIIVTVFVFIVVVEVLRRTGAVAGRVGGGYEVLRIVFYAAAISLVFVINLVHGFMLRKTGTGDVADIAARLVSVNVIAAGLSETPAIMGFVLFVGWGYYKDFYILCFVSVYLLIRHFPYYRQWEKFVRGRLGDAWPQGPVK